MMTAPIKTIIYRYRITSTWIIPILRSWILKSLPCVMDVIEPFASSCIPKIKQQMLIDAIEINGIHHSFDQDNHHQVWQVQIIIPKLLAIKMKIELFVHLTLYLTLYHIEWHIWIPHEISFQKMYTFDMVGLRFSKLNCLEAREVQHFQNWVT